MEEKKQDPKARVLTLVLAATIETKKALSKARSEIGERELRRHFDDQARQLSSYTGYPVEDIYDFLHGQQPDVAKVIAGRIGAAAVNPLGYELEEE